MKIWSSARGFLNELKSALLGSEASSSLQNALLGIALLALAAQLSVMSGFIARNVDTRATISAIDNDGGVAIGTATHTKLYDDNGWRPYGPLYYRLVRLAHQLGEHPADATQSAAATSKDLHLRTKLKIEEQNARERSHHFLLGWISLVSLAGLCGLLAYLTTDLGVYRVLLTSALLSAFSAHPTWAEMVLRPHPDHLFAALVGLATWITWRWLIAPDSRTRLLQMGAAWGLVAACKMTILAFAPGILALFIGRRPIFAWRQFLILASSALCVYLAVGFPQSFNFGGVIEFLIQQKKNVLPGTRESFFTWLELFRAQVWRPALVLILGLLLLPRPKAAHASVEARLRLLALVALPLAYLWSQKIISPIFWYPFPFIAMGLVAIALGLEDVRARLQPLERITRRLSTQAIVWVLVPFAFSPVPESWTQVFNEQQKCRTEAREVERWVNQAAAEATSTGGHILVDPYIPYSQVFHDREVEMAWEMRLDRIRPETRMIALKSDYYRWYLSVEVGGSGGTVLHIQNLAPVREFYLKFWRQAETVEIQGAKWTRVHNDSCSFEIWQKNHQL